MARNEHGTAGGRGRHPGRRRGWALLLAGALPLASGCTTSYTAPAGLAAPEGRAGKIACLGDSITYGTGLPLRESQSYPVLLAGRLGPTWQVENFGVPGIRALDYAQDRVFTNAAAANPDVVVVLLGSNDVKLEWPGREEFRAGYASLVDAIRGWPSAPRILLCRPLPRHNGTDSQDLLSEVAAEIEALGQERGLEVVQLDKRFWNKPHLFSDGVHPSVRGARVLADEIHRALQGRSASVGDRFRSVGEYFEAGSGLGGK